MIMQTFVAQAPAAEADVPSLTSPEALARVAIWLGTLVVLALLLMGADWLLKRRSAVKPFSRHLTMMGLTLVAVLVALLGLPEWVADNQTVLQLVGLALTVIVTLSSATLVANAMAGLMLRSVRSFRAGDFIEVEEHVGRVTERGLFHVEIQTALSDLVTLPNQFLITRPTTVIRSSGTVIVADVSLGYDVAHAVLEPLFLDAARRAGLEEPFVQVRELGDYSVTYRVAGVLHDVKSLFTARSSLRRRVLDTLHEGGVEIPSPMLVGHRRLPEREPLIPKVDASSAPSGEGKESSAPAEIIFDKAEKAEEGERAILEVEELKKREAKMKEKIKSASEVEKPRLGAKLQRLQSSIIEAEARVAALEEREDAEHE